LFSAFRGAARQYEAVEQAERQRHATFEQAKRKGMEEICAEAERLFQSVSYMEGSVSGSFLVRYGLASSSHSVRPGAVHGTTGEEFSRALIDCARVAQEKSKGIQSLSTIIKVICGCTPVLLIILLCSGAGFAVAFLLSVVAAVLGSGLAVSAGSGMCRALYKAIRTAECIRDRWREGAHAYCDSEIGRSAGQARELLARELESWKRSLAEIQRGERAVVTMGNAIAPLWQDSIWQQWKPSGKKPSGVRIGDYFLRTKLPTGDDASVVVPAFVPFPGDRCLLLKTGDNVVANNQSGPEARGDAGTDGQQDAARRKRRGRARRLRDLDGDDEF
jgi:hypothetical protein